MIHKMKLNESPFERIKNGTKIIEFRLYDEKRQQIKIGDQIEFSKLPDLQEKLLVDITELYREDTFENLFRKLYTDKYEINRRTKSMEQYYSYEKEKEYGVLGIKIALINNSFRYTYNKLVRDKIPENIDSEPGRKSKYRILNDGEYLAELNKKVLEEANEFIEENSIEELGDLMEVINSIMKLKGYKMEKVIIIKELYMRKLNLIVIFNKDLSKILFCIRAKEPYKGLYNFVGGKVENGESNDEAAYRELFEETGIFCNDIELEHFMDLNYFKYENNLQVYYGILKHEVNLVEEKNKLEWVTINDELLDNSKFAGNYNIPHIIRQIKVYLKNGTEIDK